MIDDNYYLVIKEHQKQILKEVTNEAIRVSLSKNSNKQSALVQIFLCKVADILIRTGNGLRKYATRRDCHLTSSSFQIT